MKSLEKGNELKMITLCTLLQKHYGNTTLIITLYNLTPFTRFSVLTPFHSHMSARQAAQDYIVIVQGQVLTVKA